MDYTIKEIAAIIKATSHEMFEATISYLLTDSRSLAFPETSLFFAIKTNKNDGHNYIFDLYQAGVRNFVVTEEWPEFARMQETNFLYVKNTTTALQKLAAHHRKRFSIPVIGITGSNGKTVVKELLYQLMHND